MDAHVSSHKPVAKLNTLLHLPASSSDVLASRFLELPELSSQVSVR
jgi:hypothetical protein